MWGRNDSVLLLRLSSRSIRQSDTTRGCISLHSCVTGPGQVEKTSLPKLSVVEWWSHKLRYPHRRSPISATEEADGRIRSILVEMPYSKRGARTCVMDIGEHLRFNRETARRKRGYEIPSMTRPGFYYEVNCGGA